MGTVYLADPAGADALVALKILTSELTADERFRQRFERESALAAVVEHPNVVPPIATATSTWQCSTRRARTCGRFCNASAALTLSVRSVCSDKSQTASMPPTAVGLVHRDVKPANILVADGADDAARPPSCPRDRHRTLPAQPHRRPCRRLGPVRPPADASRAPCEGEPRERLERASDLLDRARRAARCPRRDSRLAH